MTNNAETNGTDFIIIASDCHAHCTYCCECHSRKADNFFGVTTNRQMQFGLRLLF